ncbi:hypothetical protein [Oryzibacter oryziterrae]|uniref:hypothetical protein n=1 Tax=Oryzibacter oryziterrae TaxID=2766474 RepID=UPI001F3F6515|nr:hypothetical protein [Oryzibacter oryziterrae]
MGFRYRLTTSVTAIVVFAGLTGTGYAATPEEFTAALTKLVQSAPKGGSITLGTPTEQDGAIVYKDVVLKMDKDESKIATLTVTGGDVGADGAVSAETMLAEGVSGKSENNTYEIESFELDNAVFTGKETGNKVDSVAIQGITSTETGKPATKIDSISLDLSDYANDVPHGVDLAIEGVQIDPAIAGGEGDATAQQLKAMGYDKLSLNFYGTGSLDQDSGDLSIDELTVSGDDMGSVTLTGVLGGFSPDVLKQLAQPNPPPEIATKVTLKEAALSYYDSSLAGRVISMQAKAANQEPAAFVDQITGALPLLLTVVGNQGFQDKLAAGATTFLKDPKNITISVAPATPISLMDVFMKAQTEPQALPDTLKADVVANQPEDDGDEDSGTDGGDAGTEGGDAGTAPAK